MIEEAPQRTFRWPDRPNLIRGLILVSSAALAIWALLMPFSTRTLALPVEEGDVASQDFLAPYAISYESQVLTAELTEAAAQAVEPIFAPPNTSIARAQVEQIRNVLLFITNVREDSFSTPDQKLIDLAALQDINLSPESAQSLLDLSESNWQSVQQEAIAVLGQVMRTTIREDRLEDARRGIPTLVSFSLSEEEADLVAELVTAFVAPNSLYSEVLTEAAREQARLEVEPIIQTYLPNETIVPRGRVISDSDLEALDHLGLVQGQVRWQDQASAVLLVIVSSALVVIYLRLYTNLSKDTLSLGIIAILFLGFLFAARITIPGRTVIPYFFPVAGFSLLVTSLFSTQAAIILAIPLSILVTFEIPNTLELTLLYMLSSLFGALILNRARRIATYFWAGAAVSIVSAVVVLIYRLPDPATDLIGITTLLGAAGLNGLAAASLTIVLQYFFAQIIGLTTAIQLQEVSRPDHPLLQFILRNAPGSYQHSLQISNLAEQAAEIIGADTLLTRVGALYHDAGKARYPHFFIENQIPNTPNPHDELTPLESSAVILRHIPDGLDLASKHKLPRRIRDFIAEHHGTMITRYQYAKALEAVSGDASKVDEEDFRYIGPRPQSRETALVMLADGSEARARAERPDSQEELNALVKDVISNRLMTGQLDDTELTMHDLNLIAESFSSTLRGIYHPRIKYPKIVVTSSPPSEKPVKN